MLRNYQQRSIDMLYDWLSKNYGHACLVLPTGSGKSHIVAALCKDAVQNWPNTRVLMLTHTKELISQNAEKMRQHWKNAPLGIYSASLNKKQIDAITFAGIQSVRTKSKQLGHIDLCIIDECFVSGTKISTPNGLIDIDKVKCGDLVYNQCGVGVVEATSCKQSKNIYILELNNGKTIECTGNHKFFTKSGWKEARNLESGENLFSIEDMSRLWERVSSLDKKNFTRENYIGTARTFMEQAKFLLSTVCKEISSNSIDSSSKKENKQQIERNKTQTYKTWRQRAIASFATTSTFTCTRRRLGSGITYKNTCRASKWSLSKLLQGGYWEQYFKNSNRNRWWKPWDKLEAKFRYEKNSVFSKVRVVSISRKQRKGHELVFNIQVSGHPSYFANGVAVHNCHLISHKNEGGYRTLINELLDINPDMRVIGLSATPYRLGHGLITDKPALFDGLIEPVKIDELVRDGYLAPLRSKLTKEKLSTDGVHKRGGDFIESELQKAVDIDSLNDLVVKEVIRLSESRKAWLFFCTGIDHAYHIKESLIKHGIIAECVTGQTPKAERDRILNDFKAGKIQALTNCDILTVGFDYPDIDLIAMLRPTMSPSLYVQMAGRGMRLKSHTDHCLVLDFAGVVETHGPITNVKPPKKGGVGDGEMPIKLCDQCFELVHISAPVCPACGFEFPKPEPKPLVLHNHDIMGIEGLDLDVSEWEWKKHNSKANGNEMIKVTYYGSYSDAPISEYLCILHSGYAGTVAMKKLLSIATKCGVFFSQSDQLDDICKIMNAAKPPAQIEYKREGKYFRVLDRVWI